MDERIAALAAANGWHYRAEGAPPALGAGLWEQATSGVARDQVSGPGWEAGNLTGGDRSASRVEQIGGVTLTRTVSVSTPEDSLRIGYLAITLPRRMPHLILDATGNGRALQRRPRADQRMRLEGDFDRHFHLYAPRGYERDALYVFTPDLMALLIDETGDLDVEVHDDRLLVLRPGGFDLAEPATWERFERIRTTVGRTARSRTALYADERAPASALVLDGADDAAPATGARTGGVSGADAPDGGVGPGTAGIGSLAGTVAPEGRRLRPGLPRVAWVAIAIGAGVLVFVGTVVTIVFTALARTFGG